VGADAIPPQVGEIEALARLWEREQRLMNLALYVDADELDGEAAWAAIERLAAGSPGRMFIASREPRKFGAVQTSVFEIARPTVAERRAAWRGGLRHWYNLLRAHAREAVEGDEESRKERARRLGLCARDVRVTSLYVAPRLADSFSLANTDILQTLDQQVNEHYGDHGAQPLYERLWDVCRTRTRPRLDTLATRIEVKASKKQIVLPQQQLDMLDRIVEQVRLRWRVYENWGFEKCMNRGLGISALFAGDSGTGKTMAAEVIAHELKLDLYRIDLSGVISKYIGETEKNLRRVFDAAEDGGAILFFDEADAIFGRRSEIKDSHDRYANIEINYLLQRMETYRGLAILATNRKNALDPAFLRRLRFVVDFPFPGATERRTIWQNAFPQRQDYLDYTKLSKLNLSGGSIHNVALAAAFIAEASGASYITTPMLMTAARQELRKLERPFNENDLRMPDEASTPTPLGAAG
jgi:hypothetical protein